LAAHRQSRNSTDLAGREKGEDLVSRVRAHPIIRRVFDALVLGYRQTSRAVAILVLRRVRAEPERIRKIDGIAVRVAIQIEPARQPNGVLLREIDGLARISATRARQDVAALSLSGLVAAVRRRTSQNCP
jgi:hypothetical protein